MQGRAKRRILGVFKRARTQQTGQNPPERRRGDSHHGLLDRSPGGNGEEQSIATRDDRWYTVGIMPCRTLDHRRRGELRHL